MLVLKIFESDYLLRSIVPPESGKILLLHAPQKA